MFNDATLFRNEIHHVADVFIRAHDVGAHDGFLNRGNQSDIWHVGWIIQLEFCAIGLHDTVNDIWIGRDDIHVVLAPQPLLYDLQMQQAKKAATKPETQCGGAFLLINKGRVIQLQLCEVVF